MTEEAIPIYEMALKSNEELKDKIKLIRLAQNDSAIISCRIYDSGFEADSLSLLRNGQPQNTPSDHVKSYHVKNYNMLTGSIDFTCSAKKKNGKIQSRDVRVTGKLQDKIPMDQKPCNINNCKNDGICMVNHGVEYCICPSGYSGNLCKYMDHLGPVNGTSLETNASAQSTYLYVSMGLLFIMAVIMALLYGREKLKRAKTKKQLHQSHHQEESNSLQAYEVCDGREDAMYLDQKVTKTYIINEYDNVPADERAKVNSQQRPIIRGGVNNRDSIGVTEEIARAGKLKPDYLPRPILAEIPTYSR